MQVIFMTATHELLLDRAKHRLVDYANNYEPFQVLPQPSKEASPPLSPAILPRDATGAVDSPRLATLKPRHDDSQENVRARLLLWDVHLADVRLFHRHCYCSIFGFCAEHPVLQCSVTAASADASHGAAESAVQQRLTDTCRCR
jgi:hypothetical protein